MENISYNPYKSAHKGSHHMKEMCDRYHHHMVQIEADDGRVYEGILDGHDDNQLYLLVPTGDQDADDMRQYPYGYGYGYPNGYGYPYWGYPFYGYPRRFRRFRRFGFPFFGLRSFFFPFFF